MIVFSGMPPDEQNKNSVSPPSPASHKPGLQLLPEIIPDDFSDEAPQNEQQLDPDKSLDQLRVDAELMRLRHRYQELEQQLQETRENHQLRQTHAKKLFVLAICWIAILWMILLIQGFGSFPIPSLIKDYENLEFKLSDSVLIAFMTSTTTTVVGLYGIAAYWLFRAKKDEKKKKNKADKKNGAAKKPKD